MGNYDLTGLFIAMFCIGVLIGLALGYGLPWLWLLIKPWLHVITA